MLGKSVRDRFFWIRRPEREVIVAVDAGEGENFLFTATFLTVILLTFLFSRPGIHQL